MLLWPTILHPLQIRWRHKSTQFPSTSLLITFSRKLHAETITFFSSPFLFLIRCFPSVSVCIQQFYFRRKLQFSELEFGMACAQCTQPFFRSLSVVSQRSQRCCVHRSMEREAFVHTKTAFVTWFCVISFIHAVDDGMAPLWFEYKYSLKLFSSFSTILPSFLSTHHYTYTSTTTIIMK